MKIFLDFDDVLFNSGKFIQDEKEIFEKFGVSEEVFKQHYYHYRKDKNGREIRIYDLEKQLEGIEKELGMNTEKLKKKLEIFLSDTSGYIFPDVIPFLEKFKKEKLFIVSYSQTDFQKAKIGKSGISEYFSGVKITSGNKSKAIADIIKEEKDPEEVMYFLDDRAEYICEAKKKIFGLKAIFMRRPEGRYQDSKCPEKDFEAKNLAEVSKIIQNQQKLCVE